LPLYVFNQPDSARPAGVSGMPLDARVNVVRVQPSIIAKTERLRAASHFKPRLGFQKCRRHIPAAIAFSSRLIATLLCG
jgi:hypothetical protein